MNADGISDVVLTLITLGAFVCGFALGCFNFGRMAGIACLSALGGISIGVRVILLRPGLLVHTFAPNWAIIAVFGIITFVLVFTNQRAAIVSSFFVCAFHFTNLVSDDRLCLNRHIPDRPRH